MRILQITNSFYPVIGGQEKVVLEISKGLIKEGHEVTVLTTDYLCDSQVNRSEDFENIKIMRFRNKFWFGGYGYSPGAMNWLKKNYSEFDIIHCHGYNRYLPEFGIKFLSGKVPTIFSAHGFVHTKKNLFFKKVHDFTFGRWIDKATLCTALTRLDLKDYEKLGVEREKIVELPNGVDIGKFSKPNKKEIDLFRKKFDLDGNVLLYVGRIHESKGLQYVLEAIKNLEVKLLIVGKDAGYMGELVKKINVLGIKEKVVFAGPLSDDELLTAYGSASAFVLFSEWEGFGIVVIEAMAAGLPVISSDGGALPFLVRDAETGQIVEFKNIKKLENKIKLLLENSSAAIKMGKRGKEFSKNYSWDNVLKKVLRIYSSVRKL